MPVNPETPLGRARHWLLSGWAGVMSAIVCYAEYLGMGALLGSALLGQGSQAKSVGTLLIVASAVIACLCLAACGRPFLAGPRGASLSVVVAALLSLQISFAPPPSLQVLLLAFITLGSVLGMLLMSRSEVRDLFAKVPSWVVHSFIYASAVSIVSGAVTKYLDGCIHRHELTTWSIFATATLLGVLWPWAWSKLAKRSEKRNQPSEWMRRLESLGLILAGALAWIIYSFTDLNAPGYEQCARLGSVDLDLSVITARAQSLFPSGFSLSMWAACLSAITWGLMAGVIASVETKITVDILNTSPATLRNNEPLDDQAILRENAGINALMVPATSVTASLSLSRTQVLHTFYQSSSVLPVVLHAISLAAIALLASQWIGKLPHIALTVLMTLVGTQMLTKLVKALWKNAYNPQNNGKGAVLAGFGFWWVLGISVLTNQPLYGLAVPMVACLVWMRVQQRRVRSADPAAPD